MRVYIIARHIERAMKYLGKNILVDDIVEAERVMLYLEPDTCSDNECISMLNKAVKEGKRIMVYRENEMCPVPPIVFLQDVEWVE